MVLTPINSSSDAFGELKDYGENVYFTSVTQSGDYIMCTDENGTECLKFEIFEDTNMNKTYIRYVEIYGTTLNDNYTNITYIVRTQYGLVIQVNASGGNDDFGTNYGTAYIIITKDNQSHTVIFAHNAKQYSYGAIDNTTFVCSDSAYPQFNEKKCLYSKDLNLLSSTVPVVVDGTMNFCPNLKFLVQKQYIVCGEIVIGTEHYWTDSQVVLKDT